MKQGLIVPNRDELKDYLELVKEYSVGFEYNDFFNPEVLDSEEKLQGIISDYKRHELPAYTTLHGAFLDIVPFSADGRICEIAMLRIRQSIEAARRMGAQAVVFHANYNPYLNSQEYIKSWLDKNIVFWSKILREYEDLNIYLENMFEESPDIMEALSEGLCMHTNYGICLDYAHAFLSKTDTGIWAQKLGCFVKHVHINDNDGICDRHWAWGDGVICRTRFYDDYAKYMKDATVLIETASVENARKSLKMLKQEGFIDL